MVANSKSHWSSSPGAGGSNGGGIRLSGRESVMWSEKMSEYLIDTLLHQQAIGNRTEGRFLTAAFESVITGIGERFGVTIDRSNIKNRLKSIKDCFHECENLFDKEGGIKWSPVTRKFHAEPHVWREFIERKPEAKKWMTKTIDHYDRLLELFGKDRVKRLPVENPKGTPKKKARKEQPQEPQERPQRTQSKPQEKLQRTQSKPHEKPQRTQSKPQEKPQRAPSKPMEKPQRAPSKPQEKTQQTPSDGLDLDIIGSLNQMVNENEVLDENNTLGELNLSELCRSENGIVAIPVRANAYGKGLPYAPENWPCPGDEWYWKVGCRGSAHGHWIDRYLTPPSRFRDATGKKATFTSKLKVEEFLKNKFPDTDPSAFFSMFIWKIPSEGHMIQRGTQQLGLNEPEHDFSDPAGPCKARNNLCKLEREEYIETSPAQGCDICCTIPTFCRECCCILCRKVVDYSFGGYGYIKCEAVVEENYICGHVAHIDCALRTFMAGTVGGSIGLDVQYYCRRCDNKTSLMLHVEKLLETCQSLKSKDEIEPILNTGLCILRGSRQARAKNMEKFLGSAMAKLKCGVDLVEVWKIEDGDGIDLLNEEGSPTSGATLLGIHQAPEENTLLGYPYHNTELMVDSELQRAVENLPVFITGDHKVMSVKFEDEIDRTLKELKRSQEAEYKLAEQKLYSQKDYILSQYRQLESARSELSDPMPLSDTSHYSVLLTNVLNRVDQVKREEEKFKAMVKVANGFGRTPANIVQEHFGLSPDK